MGLKFSQVGIFVGEGIFRYYLGVVLIYWFVKVNDIKLDIQRLIKIFCVVVFIEAIFINVFFDPFRYLPNYPLSVFENNIASHYTKFMGFYQRPYSVGMNASASVTVICGMLMYRCVLLKLNRISENMMVEVFGAFAVLLFASGVGLSLYFFYLMYRFQLITIRRSIILLTICYLLISYYSIIFQLFSSDSIFQKVSAGYINFLFEFKNQQIEDVISILKVDNNSLFIGQAFRAKNEVILQSDFAWNDFFQCLGLSGLGLFFIFLGNKMNKNTIFPVFLFLVGAFHYGGMFTLAGQIVLAQVLFTLSKSPKQPGTEFEVG